MHGFFLTCTKNLAYIYTIHNQSLTEPHVKRSKEPPPYSEGQCLAYGGESPSTLVPCLVATAPTFDSYPLHPFPILSARITLYCNDINNICLLCLGRRIIRFIDHLTLVLNYRIFGWLIQQLNRSPFNDLNICLFRKLIFSSADFFRS
jgi:hypothetical protein